MVERLDLTFVKEFAGLEISDDGLVAPAIPQAACHIDEFFGDLVAQLVVGMRAAEVAAGSRIAEVVTAFQAARPPLM